MLQVKARDHLLNIFLQRNRAATRSGAKTSRAIGDTLLESKMIFTSNPGQWCSFHAQLLADRQTLRLHEHRTFPTAPSPLIKFKMNHLSC
ncbi:MAG: hypothetical protein DI538_03335 [Azospira oryzae]|nr:MAG: hypothetical protein DI538_03335 [Azospira oryzae]